MNLPRSIYQFSILVMDIFCGIVLRFLASVVDHIENLVKLFVDSNPYKSPHDEPIRVHTVYTKLFSSDGIIVSPRCGNKVYYQGVYRGVVPRCGTEVWYWGVVWSNGTYRTPRTFFPLWWTNSCIAIFFMLCWFIFSSTMFILNSNRLFDIAVDPDTVDFSSFQTTSASSRTWSPRLYTPPTDWL